MSTLRLFLLITFTILCLPALYSQIQNTWVGGTPGRETDWNCHKNWSKYKVPNEFNDVIISDTRSTTFMYPVIEKGTITINSLEMHPGTALYIRDTVNLIILDQLYTPSSLVKIYQEKGMIKFVNSNSGHLAPIETGNKSNLKMNICSTLFGALKN